MNLPRLPSSRRCASYSPMVTVSVNYFRVYFDRSSASQVDPLAYSNPTCVIQAERARVVLLAAMNFAHECCRVTTLEMLTGISGAAM